MMYVVPDACHFEPDRSAGVIVVESDNVKDFTMAIDELGSPEAKQVAIGFAAQNGIVDTRINGYLSTIYPVNREGLSLEHVKDPKTNRPLDARDPRMQPARYRVDIPVCRRLA